MNKLIIILCILTSDLCGWYYSVNNNTAAVVWNIFIICGAFFILFGILKSEQK